MLTKIFHRTGGIGDQPAFIPTPISSNPDHAYSALCKLFIRAAVSSISQGFCHSYIPTWDEECDMDNTEFLDTELGNETAIKASNLTNCLNQRCKETWEETVQDIDFTHSSKLAWKTFQHQTGKVSDSHNALCQPTPYPSNSLQMANFFLILTEITPPSLSNKTTNLWNTPGVDGFLSEPFSSESFLQYASSRVVRPGTNNIPPPPPPPPPPTSLCCTQIWQNKPVDNPRNYRPIFLLCVPFLLLARLEPIVDQQLYSWLEY